MAPGERIFARLLSSSPLHTNRHCQTMRRQGDLSLDIRQRNGLATFQPRTTTATQPVDLQGRY